MSASLQAQQPRVLIVDDEMVIRRLVERYCAGLGAKVLVASSVDEAERILHSGPVDAMVIDKNMPGGSGLDLLRRVRQRTPGLVAVIMTADPTDDSRAEAERLGATAYLAKPFALSQLDAALNAALRRATESVKESDSVATVRRLRALTSMLRDINDRAEKE